MSAVDVEAWGIATGYRDHRQQWREAPRSTVEAVAGLLGAEPGAPPPSADHVRVVVAGEPMAVEGVWDLETEDGGSVRVEGALPPDVPLGYHWLHGDRGRVRLVVAPPRCHLPEDLHVWGWAVQLYALRSRESWGMGDLGDLRRLARWAAGQGAGVLLVNPFHASLPTRQEPSPYSPSSRCFRNPIYLRLEGEGGRTLNRLPVVDRDAVWARKSAALEERFSLFGGNPAFDRYCEEGGDALEKYGVFCTLAEEHGAPWTAWPDDVRRPDGPGVERVLHERARRVRFHQWLQWLVDEQLGAAADELSIVQDVAIGCDAAGADAWLWQDAFCSSARVGAPPDEFNTRGQDWGLPPFDPWRLRAAAYEPFVRIVRSAFRHAGGIRIDHVMGLFRLFWVPPGASPAEGTYVAYPWRDLLGIVALESVRAGAYVVGEDLGTVEAWMQEELARRGVLSYRLLWFEQDRPSAYPRQALAAVTTHDLPMVAGLWSGRDLEEQRRLGLAPNEEGTAATRARLAEWIDAGPALPVENALPVEEVVVRTHRLLADAPSMVVTATLDDAVCSEARPNVPGTTIERPNWSLPLPKTLEEIETDPLVEAVGGALRDGRATSAP